MLRKWFLWTNIHERVCLWLLFFTGVHKSPHRTPKNTELANIAVVVVVVLVPLKLIGKNAKYDLGKKKRTKISQN